MGLSFNPQFSDVVDSSYTSGVITVGTSEVLAAANGSSNLTGRQELIIYNDSSVTIYFGPTGVTVSGGTKGIPIGPQETINIQMGAAVNIYLIAGTSSNSVIVQEFS